MGKGHGTWERVILAALENVPAFYLTDLLPDPHTRSQNVSLNRAARNLAANNKIALVRWSTSFHRKGDVPRGFVGVYRIGHPVPERRDIRRLNVAEGFSKPGATIAAPR